MRFIILLATLCLAAAYPSDDNSEFVDVDVPKPMDPSNTAETVADSNSGEEMPGSLEVGADKESSNDKEKNPEGDLGEKKDTNDELSKEPTTNLCTKEGHVLDSKTCGYVMCSKDSDGNFHELYRQLCPHQTCFDEENNRCEWKSKLNRQIPEKVQ
ncbi:uncharacterized protein LOC141538399 [Cotesia typhae]|uniref:uncharacterized protein LOC141538399 n=1 Tax=Cotesia typhae TaxID=2053667 RepID=UPI003D695DAD